MTRFFHACAEGDLQVVREMLAPDPALVHQREPGDNATPLHIAASNWHLEIVRLLLDAGADVHGHGDLHDGDVVGWASAEGNEAVIDLLLARGARHHIFSAIALGDPDPVEKVVREARRSLEVLKRLNEPAEENAIKAAVREADAILMMLVEGVHGSLQVLRQPGTINPRTLLRASRSCARSAPAKGSALHPLASHRDIKGRALGWLGPAVGAALRSHGLGSGSPGWSKCAGPWATAGTLRRRVTRRTGRARKATAGEESLEAGIGSKGVPPGIGGQKDKVCIALFIGSIEPLEDSLLLAETSVDERHRKRRHVALRDNASSVLSTSCASLVCPAFDESTTSNGAAKTSSVHSINGGDP